MTYLLRRMSEKHEGDLAKWLRGRKTRGSGNQWNGPADGRQNRYSQRFAFAWDCKATLQKAISVNRRTWAKLEEQAGGERPLLPLRFYATETLAVDLDLVVMRMDDLRELVTAIEDLETELADYRRDHPDPVREGNPV